MSHAQEKNISRLFGKTIVGSLRAIGQVAYVNSAVSGLIILIASFVASPPVAFLGFASAMIGTVIGLNIAVCRKEAIIGLHGYDGFLAGAGVGYFDSGLRAAPNDWSRVPYLIVPMILTALTTSLVYISLRRFLSTPPFTFAYNLALSCWLAFATSLGTWSTLYPNFSPPELTETGYLNFFKFMRCVVSGVGEVYFVRGYIPGIIVLCGLAVGSPLAGLLGLLGSFVGIGIVAVSHSFTLISGYEYFGINAVLAAIGIGCFFTVPSLGSVVLAVLISIITVAVRFVFLDLFVSDGPALTFPFCVTAFFIIHAVRVIKYPVLVPESLRESPERNWAFRQDFLLSARKVSDVNTDESHNAVWADQPDSQL